MLLSKALALRRVSYLTLHPKITPLRPMMGRSVHMLINMIYITLNCMSTEFIGLVNYLIVNASANELSNIDRKAF